ncbi:hypothetical protein HY375_03845 [Candidatus Berkelbacteria bacterium]|nr:hypothetical protein [Candidatus Berkelbacteria bacterium]
MEQTLPIGPIVVGGFAIVALFLFLLWLGTRPMSEEERQAMAEAGFARTAASWEPGGPAGTADLNYFARPTQPVDTNGTAQTVPDHHE